MYIHELDMHSISYVYTNTNSQAKFCISDKIIDEMHIHYCCQLADNLLSLESNKLAKRQHISKNIKTLKTYIRKIYQKRMNEYCRIFTRKMLFRTEY